MEFDIAIALAGPATWQPCEQRDGACTSYDWSDPTGTVYKPGAWFDLQTLVTHEAGHAIGLGDLAGHQNCLMTMAGGTQVGSEGPAPPECSDPRFGSSRLNNTLALGDVLGARALYPWSCPKLKKGQRFPPAYRYVCPSIQIFVP